MVITDCSDIDFDFSNEFLKPDFVYTGKNVRKRLDGIAQICDSFVYDYQSNTYPVFNIDSISDLENTFTSIKFLKLSFSDLSLSLLQRINKISNLILLLYCRHSNRVAELRAAFHFLMSQSCRVPAVITESSLASNHEEEQIIAGLDFGPLLLDGFGDGVFLSSSHLKNASYPYAPDKVVSILFGVLQASRLRMSKTEYISCPGCGRTLYDLQKTIGKIKLRTSHLKGLKIGIMGCIVNGPGEMADADYGYVGAGRNLVSLYKGQKCVDRSIPEGEAVERLIDLIRANGDWIDP